MTDLLGSFNTPAANNTLQQFLSVKGNYFKKEVALLLLKNKQVVPAWAFDSIAADRIMRANLYEELKDLKKANLFPKKYLTQAYFAETDMVSAAYDDVEPAAMDFIRLQKATFKGKVYNFYLYKVRYNGDDKPSTYLGISGGWDSKGKKLEPLQYLSGIYYEEEFDAGRIFELMESYLQTQSEE